MIFWKNESKKKCFWDYLNLTSFGFSFILWSMDYGHPMKPFSIEIHNFWAWADKLGHLGYFRPIYKLPTPILVQFPCFPLFNHYFCKKVSVYVHNPNIWIWIWASKNYGFSFHVSVVRGSDKRIRVDNKQDWKNF